MKKNIYRLVFMTKKGGWTYWAIDVEADNQKEAEQTAREMWKRDAHLFKPLIRKLQPGDELLYNYFKRGQWSDFFTTNSKGAVIK